MVISGFFFLFLRFWFGTWISNTIHRFTIALLQGPRQHGFDGFGRTHQFWEKSCQTHIFLGISLESYIFTQNCTKIRQFLISQKASNQSIEIPAEVPVLYTYVRTMFSIFYRLRVFLLPYTYFLRKLIWQDYKTSRFLQAKQVDIWSLRIHNLKVCWFGLCFSFSFWINSKLELPFFLLIIVISIIQFQS